METLIRKIAVAAFSLIFLMPVFTSYCIWKGADEKGLRGFLNTFDSYGDAVFVLGLAALGVFIFCALVF